MKKYIQHLFLFVLFFSFMSCQQKTTLLSLEGTTLSKNETNHSDAFLQLEKETDSKGTVLLLSENNSQTDSLVKIYEKQHLSVAILKGNVNLENTIKAFRLIKSNINNTYTCITGCLNDAKYAALAEYELNETERPNDLILINPKGLEETTEGTVFPLINPPLTTKTRLLCLADTLTLTPTELKASSEYTKTWIGYDGIAFYKEQSKTSEIKSTLFAFRNGDLSLPQPDKNPAAVPVEGYSPKRHAEKLALVKKHKYDLIFVGNSITNNFEKPQYQPVWNKYFGVRNALNLGYSGYRTENIIWNLQNGELEGQSPKVIVLGIGTNNIDEKNYPTRHTAGQLAGGIKKIISILREKCPESKIILLRCFPGCYGGPNPTSHRRILERASDIVSHLADNEHVFYCDVNHVFLNMDGSINKKMLGDWLHPTPEGAKKWAQAMEPLLCKLMGDQSHNNEIPLNSAIVPTPKLENDSYDWWVRHNDVLNIKDTLNPDIVLIGNSITHFWGGKYPPLKYADGTHREPNGPNSWEATFKNHTVLNLGFGWDRTQNVLWRLDHGEFDALNPKLVIIHIGTNNTSETENARMNTATEIVEGIKAVCKRVRSKAPRAQIVLMQIMPREEQPDNPRRILINETNKILSSFATENNITLLDISKEMLTKDGKLTKEITSDFCHPTDKGYEIWGSALKPFIKNIEH